MHSTSELAANAGWEDVGNQSLDSLGDLLLLAGEAEYAARGYVLSGREDSAERFRASAGEIERNLDALRALHSGDPAAERKVGTFAKLVSEQLDDLRRAIELRRAGRPDAARSAFFAGGERRRARVLGDVVRRMQAEEVGALVERAEAGRWHARRSVMAIFLTSLFALLFLAVAGLHARREGLARHKAEQDRSRLAAIVESSDQCIYSTTLDGTVTSWNRGAEILYGYSADEMLGKSALALVPPSLAGQAAEYLKTLASGNPIESGDTVRLRKSGERVDVSISASPIRDSDGAVTGVSAVVRDVSLKKRAEQELAKARDAALHLASLKSSFVANVSHEIRTPMNAIIGMTELLLLEKEVPERQRELLETVQASAESLLSLLNDILDFSKLEAGRIELEKLAFEPRQTLASVARLLEQSAGRKGVALRVEADPALEGRLTGDPARLRQVLINLVSNAIKFTDNGEVLLQAAKAGESDGGVDVRFAVKDTGIGISPEGQKRLFQPFTQADSSTTRKYGGTGLGLAISKQLVELMGGELKLDSQPDRGSTFYFTARFPRAAADAAGAAESAGAPPSLPPRPSFKILVVDDNEVNLKVALLQLRKLGYHADTAADGQAALAAAAASKYDLILMDCQMPVMDGFEATRELRRRQGASHRTPIVAMTANATSEDRKRCLDAGMDDHIAKPFTLPQLTAVLQRWDTPIDPGALESLKAVAFDAATLAEIVDTFVKDGAERLAAMRAAVSETRWTDLGKQAHALRGASGGVGAKRLAEACGRLEAAAPKGEAGPLSGLVEEVAAEYERAASALKQEGTAHA